MTPDPALEETAHLRQRSRQRIDAEGMLDLHEAPPVTGYT